MEGGVRFVVLVALAAAGAACASTDPLGDDPAPEGVGGIGAGAGVGASGGGIGGAGASGGSGGDGGGAGPGPGGAGPGGAGGAGGAGGPGGAGPGGAGPGGAGGSGGSPNGPTVVAVSPDGQAGIAAGASITVQFSEAMDAASLGGSGQSTACSGAIQLSSDGFTSCTPFNLAVGSPADEITLTPSGSLDSLGTYVVRVTATAESALGVAAIPADSAGFSVAYFGAVTVDGTNDFDPAQETLPTSTQAGQLHVAIDAGTLYVGLSHPDIQTGGAGDKFAYFLFSTDPTLSAGASLSSDGKAAFAGGARMMYQYRERVDGGLFSDYRIASGEDWSTSWGAANKTAVRANGFLEASIALSELGAPSFVAVTAFLIDYDGDNANGWVYAMLGSSTDGSAATPRPIESYLQLSQPLSVPPSDPALTMGF